MNKLFSFLLCFILSYQYSFSQNSQFGLWGVTGSGGDGHGTIFNVNPDGSNFIKAKTFEGNKNGERPRGILIQGLDGSLYGVADAGGVNGAGTIYKLNTDGTGYTVLHSFNGADGKNPYDQLFQATNGNLYGMTLSGGIQGGGVIYQIKPDGSGYTVLHKFTGDGSQPQGALIQATNGDLYGMTTQGGTSDAGIIFKIKLDGTGFTRLINFAGKGINPFGNLVQGSDGKLYGMTAGGGSESKGIIFKVDVDGTNFITLLDFNGSNGAFPSGTLIKGTGGEMYGAAGSGIFGFGVIFKLSADGTNYTKLFEFNNSNGSYPESLTYTSGGKLVGMTSAGGPNSLGTVFMLNTDGTGFSNLLQLDGVNGSAPYTNGILEATNGDFYGLSCYGGISNKGVIFRLKSNSTYTKLFEFYVEAEGGRSNMIMASDNNLYGVTAAGGLYGFGIIFKINKDGSGFTKFFDFDKKITGGEPQGSLFQASNGDLYGLTNIGGLNNAGTLFKIKLDGSGFTKLYDFSFSEGGYPIGSLIEPTAGELIGATSGGGVDNGGTLFKISLLGTGFSVLFNFASSTGKSPSELVLTGDGNLLGMCSYGGANDKGSLFRIKPNGTDFVKLIDFDGAIKGAYPKGGLTKISANEFIGTTSSGGVSNGGTVFRINADGFWFSSLYSFSILTGNSPLAGSLTLAPDGYLYGMTWIGGTESGGIIFKIKSDGSGFSKIYNLTETSGNYPFTVGLVVVAKENQTITFSGPSSKTFGDLDFTLSAIASSGLPVSFTSSDKVTISGSQVKMNKPGSVTIKADQLGNFSYAAAISVSQSFCINPAKPVITTTGLNSGTPVLTSSSSNGNQWFKNGTLIADAISNTFTPTEGGTYSVKVTVDNCSSELSAEQILVITGDLNSKAVSDFYLYPNPVTNVLAVNLTAFESNANVEIVIYDPSGKVIENFSKRGEKAVVSVSSFLNGIYFISATQHNKTLVAKFVKE